MTPAKEYFINRLADDMTRLANMTLGDLLDMKQKAAQQEAEIAALKFEASWTPTVQPLDEKTWV